MTGRQSFIARSGLTLIESLILLVVLTIVGVGVGLQASVRTPAATEQALVISAELNSELETWRAVAFKGAPWPSSLPYNAAIPFRSLSAARRVRFRGPRRLPPGIPITLHPIPRRKATLSV